MKLIMQNLRAGSTEDFVLGLVKKFKPGKITVIPGDEDCRALIDFADEADAHRAIEHFLGKKNALEEYDPAADAACVMAPRTTIKSNGLSAATPYAFADRKKPNRTAPTRKHECLNGGQHYDIAFDVEWVAETPVAANPCTADIDDTCPTNLNKKYQGYAKRWLMVGNRLALSPFTVKSAVANGVASLLGSCYRVMDNKVEGHKPDLTEGTYAYNGKFKRYRVGRLNSKPGILRSIDPATGEVAIDPVTGEVAIEPVIEFYYDSSVIPEGMKFIKDSTYFVRYVPGQKNIIQGPTDISCTPLDGNNVAEVTYYGPYKFGMDLTFGPGEFGKGHYHRFYRLSGKTIRGSINTLNLQTKNVQMDQVHLGVFKKLKQTAHLDRRSNDEFTGKPWHQDLSNLQPGDWVYYQAFNGQVAAIGKNYQFKTAFLHSDAVPVGQDACKDVKILCPRCSLFGMVDGTGSKTREAAGFKGRFKAAALVSNLEVSNRPIDGQIRYENDRNHAVFLSSWTHNDQEVSRQFLLPIMGGPKPNKRDEGCYYQNGMLKGAKSYRHAMMTWRSLEQLITQTNNKDHLDGDAGMPYSHDLRNYAQVCREGLGFSGTMGAENCSTDEVAALLLLLDRRLARHGFKIGLGRPHGLGSMSSIIKKLWVRKAGSYEWQQFELSSESETSPMLPQSLGDIQKAVNTLKNIHCSLMKLDQGADSLQYPQPGRDYWKGNFR
jgi:hypothetical protein